MPFLTTIVVLLISKVFLVIVALSCRCSSYFLLLFLGKCCTLGCYQSSTLDRLVLILAGAVCYIWDFFWYIPTSA
jgi:hypothetical protein